MPTETCPTGHGTRLSVSSAKSTPASSTMGRNYRKRKADDDADEVEVAEPVPSEDELRCGG